MKTPTPRLLLLAACAAAFLAAGLRADEATHSIKFSDPARPGQMKIVIGRGDVRVQASDTDQITVTSEAKAVGKSERKDGLRVISAASSFSLTEKNNVVTLDAMSDAWHGGGADFRITVPRATSLVVQNSWGGEVFCAGVEGDIEVNSLNGEVRLEDVAGGVVVSTMNGEINATIKALREGKPLSFTSMNGEVDLRVPADARANVRFRTQNGMVLTDFEDDVLVTKTESAPRMSRKGRMAHGALPVEAQVAIREATRVAVQVGREAAEAVREGFEAAREASEADRARADADHARAEADLARAGAERARAGRQGDDEGGAIPVPPVPPMPPVPTISGGKLVTGTLNGGGPEISVSTMNGDVTLRAITR